MFYRLLDWRVGHDCDTAQQAQYARLQHAIESAEYGGPSTPSEVEQTVRRSVNSTSDPPRSVERQQP
jgi:hypothetical protein